MESQKHGTKRAHLEALQGQNENERETYEQLLADQAFLQDCKAQGQVPRWP